MKKNRWFLRALVLLALTGALSMTVTLAAEPGSSKDPLVTLSYLNETFMDSIMQKVDQKITARNSQIAQQLGGQIGSTSSGTAASFTVVTLSGGQVLTGDIGCEVMLRVGTASCVSPSSPGLIDETTAGTLNNGGALAQNHLYMMTIEGRGVRATAATPNYWCGGTIPWPEKSIKHPACAYSCTGGMFFCKGGRDMDKFPLLWEGTSLGELTVEQEPLYTWFTARCRLPGKGIWCAWVVGDKGELRLGVLEPQNGIRRRFSRQMTAPLGSLLRGELRPAGGSAETWTAAAEPDRLFQTPWLRKQLHGARGVLTRKEGSDRMLALPYDEKKPFPLTPLFCLARLRDIGGKKYVIYAFNEKEWPVFH